MAALLSPDAWLLAARELLAADAEMRDFLALLVMESNPHSICARLIFWPGKPLCAYRYRVKINLK